MPPDPFFNDRRRADDTSIPDAHEDMEAWDAHDQRRQKDQFAPPLEPCECYCLHCQRIFMSDQMWLQRVIGGRDNFDGFWMCPTPNCGGAGFTFDIFPTDPDHPANEGWCYDDDYSEDDEDEMPASYDPSEQHWKQLDELGDDDDDIDGEEWKFGLAPGEHLPDPAWVEESRQRWEEEQKKYDQPDQRPREIEWTEPPSSRLTSGEDDIPF